MTYDLDLWTCPRYCQDESLCQILGPYIKLFSRESANKQTNRRDRFYALDRWRGRDEGGNDNVKFPIYNWYDWEWSEKLFLVCRTKCQSFSALPDILTSCQTFFTMTGKYQWSFFLSDILYESNSAGQNVRQGLSSLPDISRILPDMSSIFCDHWMIVHCFVSVNINDAEGYGGDEDDNVTFDDFGGDDDDIDDVSAHFTISCQPSLIPISF